MPTTLLINTTYLTGYFRFRCWKRILTIISILLITALNALGQVIEQWNKGYYGGIYIDGYINSQNGAETYQTCAINTPDGGYLLGGYSNAGSGENEIDDKSESSDYTFEYWIVKIDSKGTKQWDKTFHATVVGENYDSFGDEHLTSMIVTKDGGYLIGGYSESGAGQDKSEPNRGETDLYHNLPTDYWIIKVDAQGNKVWDKTFGGANQEILKKIVATPEGGFLLCGNSDSNNGGDKSEPNKGNLNEYGYTSTDYWIVKIDANGNKIWDRGLGGNLNDNLTEVLDNGDGTYLLGGTSDSDMGGDKSHPNQGSSDYWLCKVDSLGNKIWDKSLGGNRDDYLLTLTHTKEGNYLVGGSSDSEASGDKSETYRGEVDFWVIRLDVLGNKIWDKTYGGSGSDNLHSIIATDDGYLLAGTSNSDSGKNKSENRKGYSDYWLVKINASGSKLWDKTYGGIKSTEVQELEWSHNGEWYTSQVDVGNSYLKTIILTTNGDFIIGGSSDSDKGGDKSESSVGENNNGGDYDYWILKINKNGTKIWDKTVGRVGDEQAFVAILPSVDTGFLITGITTDVDLPGRWGYFAAKLKENDPFAWNLRYGGTGNENFTTIIKTVDGGYLSGGYSNSGATGDKIQNSRGENDYWIVKSDKNGKKLWDQCYGGPGDDYLNRIIPTLDGGYLLAGSSRSTIGSDKTQPSRGDRDYWIVKISNQGVKQWDKRFGGSGYDELKKVIQLATGEYILAGYSNSPANGDKSQGSQGDNDFWLVKISKTGTKIWDKRYGGKLNDALSGIVETAEGGYLLGGSSESSKGGDKSQVSRGKSDFWLVRVDKNGKKLWDKRYGGSGQDEAFSLGSNGKEFFIAGQSDSPAGGDKTRGSQGGKDYWFIKVTSTGVRVWDKRYGGNKDDDLKASILTQDGGFILAGKSFSDKSGLKSQDSRGNSDYWIVKADKDGMYQWDKRFGGSGAEDLRAITQTPDGGLLLAGKSDSDVSGDRTQPSQGGTDFWLVKVAPETKPIIAAREAVESEEPVIKAGQVNLNAYPNPFSDKVTVQFILPETQPATLKVYDSQGREAATLFQGEVQANQENEVEWKAGSKATGLYILQLQTPTQRHQQKLIIQK